MKKIAASLALLAWALFVTAQTSSAQTSANQPRQTSAKLSAQTPAKKSGQASGSAGQTSAKKSASAQATAAAAPAPPAQPFPTITQLPTGAPMLESGLGSTSFTFVVAGDNRPAHSGDPLTKAMLDIVQRLSDNPPDFVVWNGDSVFGKQEVGIGEQYAQFLGAFKPVTVPVFNAPGNHEMLVQTMISCGTASDPWNGELPDFSGSMMADYETSMGPLYGVFRYGNAAFVIINTDDVLDVTLANACVYNGYVGKTQLASLQATLNQVSSDAAIAHIFCFMHRPIKDKGGAQIGAPKGDTSDYGKQVEAFRKLLDSSKYPKMTFVFASHDHLLYVDPAPSNPTGPFTGSAPNKGKPVFIVTGGAGAPLTGCKNGKGGKPGAFFHYLTVTVSGASVTVNVVPLYGTTLCGSGT